jgi:hypothetical protein
MKMILALCAVLVSMSAFAAAPSQETAQVARALINNTDIVKQLKDNGSANLVDLQITQVKQGVFQYNLVFNRQCECVPSTATVSILEDLTPTYADGPIKYTSSISIKSGF